MSLQINRIDMIDTYNIYLQQEIIKPKQVTMDEQNTIEPKHQEILESNEFNLSPKIFFYNIDTSLFEHIHEHREVEDVIGKLLQENYNAQEGGK